MDDNDPASGLSAAMAGMTVEARSSAAVKKNVWQTRMEEQQQQRIAKERARARAEAEAEARAGAMKMVMMRERERQEEEEASSRRREQQQQAMHQQQQGHASWDMHRPPPQHQQGYPVGRIGHAPLHHARAKGPPASSPWSHYGGYTNAYNQPMAYPSNGHSHSSRSQPGRRSDGLSHHNGHLHSPSVPAWNTPLSYASRDIPPSPQETESMHVHDVNAHYRMLREQNHRQNSRDFSSQLNNYILQVLLPPILLQEWQMNLMEQGRRSIELIAQSICPGAALVPFGSVVNGLALRNSGESVMVR